jgi:hypothetical protein
MLLSLSLRTAKATPTLVSLVAYGWATSKCASGMQLGHEKRIAESETELDGTMNSRMSFERSAAEDLFAM